MPYDDDLMMRVAGYMRFRFFVFANVEVFCHLSMNWTGFNWNSSQFLFSHKRCQQQQKSNIKIHSSIKNNEVTHIDSISWKCFVDELNSGMSLPVWRQSSKE